jgi:hypothetical protein
MLAERRLILRGEVAMGTRFGTVKAASLAVSFRFKDRFIGNWQ